MWRTTICIILIFLSCEANDGVISTKLPVTISIQDTNRVEVALVVHVFNSKYHRFITDDTIFTIPNSAIDTTVLNSIGVSCVKPNGQESAIRWINNNGPQSRVRIGKE